MALSSSRRRSTSGRDIHVKHYKEAKFCPYFVYNHICFSSSSLDDLDDQNNTALKEEQKANQNPSNLPQVMHWNAGIQKFSEVYTILNVILWDYIRYICFKD